VRNWATRRRRRSRARAPCGWDRVGLRADDRLPELGDDLGHPRDASPLDHLDLTALAQLGREVAHRAEDEVAALAVQPDAAHRRARLDDQDPLGALEGRVRVRELVAEDEGRMAHQPLGTSR
jgi:hypothetical protein